MQKVLGAAALLYIGSTNALCATPLFEGLGFLPGDSFSVGEGISADGSAVVGYSNSGDNTVTQAFRWSSSTGMVGIGFLSQSNVRLTGMDEMNIAD